MSKTYIATQGVGSFLAGEIVTGLSEERVEELVKSGALVTETAEQTKLRKAAAAADADDEEAAIAAAAAKAKAEEEAADKKLAADKAAAAKK